MTHLRHWPEISTVQRPLNTRPPTTLRARSIALALASLHQNCRRTPMAFFLSLNRPFRDGHHTGRSHSPVYRFICAVELNSYEWENSDAQDQFACRLS